MRTVRPAKLTQSRRGPDSDRGPSAPALCGIIFIDAQNRVSVITDTAAQILGLSAIGRPRMLKAFPAPLQKMIAEARSSSRAILHRKIDLSLASRDTISLQLITVRATNGKKSSPVTVVLQDLTSHARAEHALRRLDRLATLGTLSAGIAHEIRNALVVGKTFFDLLLKKHEDADLVDLVRRELARIDSLVSQMLRFTGPAKPTFSELRLHDLLNHSLRLVERQLSDKSIQLDRAYSASSDLLRGDDYQLEQAFVNLLLNAIEAMGPGGRLKVTTQTVISSPRRRAALHSAEPARLRVTIQDDGIGITRENIGRLFGPFFSTKNGGTGLGLSITRRIIQEHGGVISVKSKPNQGAAFQILLPLLAEKTSSVN